MKTEIAVKYFGSRQEMADAFLVTKQLVHKFGKYLPECRAWQAMALSGGDLQVDAKFYQRKRKAIYKKRIKATAKKRAG